MEGNLAITVFGPSDPDAISSSFALGQLAEANDIDYDIIFQNNVDRPENQTFTKYLGIDIKELDSEGFEDYENISLIDCGPERLRDTYSDEYIDEIYRELVSIIDHHETDESTVATLDKNDVFHDIRPNYGSTATILADYMKDSEVEIDQETATALYYGFYTDTENTLKGWIKDDFKSVLDFAEMVDQDALTGFTETNMTSDTLDIIHRVTDEDSYEVRGAFKFANAGVLESSKSYNLAQAADTLNNQEGIDGITVAGIIVDDKEILGKVRYSGSRFTAAEIADKIAHGYGDGGGHPDTGGFTIDPGILEINISDETAQRALLNSVKKSFFKIVGKSNGE